MDNTFSSSCKIPDPPQIQIPDPPQISETPSCSLISNSSNSENHINQRIKAKVTVCKESNDSQLLFHDKREHQAPFLDLKNGFLLKVVDTFQRTAWRYMDLLAKLRDEKNAIAIKKEAILKECKEKSAEYDSIIEQNTQQYNTIIRLLSESGIKIKKYEYVKKIEYIPLYQFETLLNTWKYSNFFTKNSRKDKIASIGKSAANYFNHIIEKAKSDKLVLEQNMPLEFERIESEFEDFSRQIKLELKETVCRFTDYLKSYELQEININWEKYIEKYQISQLVPYNDNQRDTTICMGYRIYHIPVPDELDAAIHNAYDILNFIEEHVTSTNSHEIWFRVPAFDNIQDNTNKYYFKLNSSMKEKVQNGIQSYFIFTSNTCTVNFE